MRHSIEGNIEQVLMDTNAKAGDHYGDDFGNDWVVHDDREGLRLEMSGNADVWIPYWTAMVIQLPGLHRVL